MSNLIWDHSRCSHSHEDGFDSSDLTLDQLTETMQCWVNAFMPVGTSVWPWPAAPWNHDCNQSCPMFKHRNVYVCCWSGRYHVCSALACDRKEPSTSVPESETIVSPKRQKITCVECGRCHQPGEPICPGARDSSGHGGYLACPLTALVYPADFCHNFDQTGGGDTREGSDYKRNTHIDMSTHSHLTGKKKRKKTGGSDGLSKNDHSNRPHSGKPPAHPPIRFQDSYNKRLDIRSSVRALAPTLTQSELESTTDTVLSVHQNMLMTRAHQLEMPSYYTLAQHTLVVVYVMAEGGAEFNHHEYIPSSPALKCKLVKFKDQPATVVSNAQSKHNFKASKHMKFCMHEWTNTYKPIPTHTSCRG